MRVIATLVLAAVAALTPAQRQLNIDSFEKVWTTVRDKHWDPKLNGVDWQAVHDELRPKLEAAETNEQARSVMQDMLSRLHQTHFGIVAADAYKELSGKADADKKPSPEDGVPGLDVRVVDGQALVTDVVPGSPAAAQGIKPGWEVLKVDGKEIAPSLHKIEGALGKSTLLPLVMERSVTSRMEGEVGHPVTVDFRNEKGRTVTVKPDRIAPRGKLALFGNLPPEYFWAEGRKLPSNIGYFRFNLFFEPDALIGTLQKLVKECGDCRGFVIDLRGNPGGLGVLATGVAGWFAEKQARLGSMSTRSGTIHFAVFPRPDAFLGPLAVLVDGSSASTSEIFAGGLQDVKRARIFGTRTAGAALPSTFERLPNGDGFQYAYANYVSEGGKELEGNGVIPDEEVKISRKDLLAGRDSVLDAAVSWIEKQKK